MKSDLPAEAIMSPLDHQEYILGGELNAKNLTKLTAESVASMILKWRERSGGLFAATEDQMRQLNKERETALSLVSKGAECKELTDKFTTEARHCKLFIIDFFEKTGDRSKPACLSQICAEIDKRLSALNQELKNGEMRASECRHILTVCYEPMIACVSNARRAIGIAQEILSRDPNRRIGLLRELRRVLHTIAKSYVGVEYVASGFRPNECCVDAGNARVVSTVLKEAMK